MLLRLRSLEVRHNASFPAPAPVLASQSGRLLDIVSEKLATQFGLKSSDISQRTGYALSDWQLQIRLFAGQGTISITTDGFEARYSRLGSSTDLAVVINVQEALLSTISTLAPSLAYASESIGGSALYDVIGEARDRLDFFNSVSFPGRGPLHGDVGIKFRVSHPLEKLTVAFDLGPLWTDPSQVLLSFGGDTFEVSRMSFAGRAELVNGLAFEALRSLGMEIEGKDGNAKTE